MVNLDTKDLIEHYSTSLRYRDIYNYVADGRLPGNVTTQKKVTGEAANYVIVNGLLFKIAQHKESGKWNHYLLLVIPEKFESNILNMYHNSLLAMHQGALPYIFNNEKAILLSKYASQNSKIYRSMYTMPKN